MTVLNLITGHYAGSGYTRLVCRLTYSDTDTVDLSLTLFVTSIWYVLGAHRHYHGPQGGVDRPDNNKDTDSRDSAEEVKL